MDVLYSVGEFFRGVSNGSVVEVAKDYVENIGGEEGPDHGIYLGLGRRLEEMTGDEVQGAELLRDEWDGSDGERQLDFSQYV